MKPRILILSIILAATCWAPLAAQNYTFQIIADCDNLVPTPLAMNGFGVIVGGLPGPVARSMIYFDGKCEVYPSVFLYSVTDTGWLIAHPDINSAPFYLIEPGGKTVNLPGYPRVQDFTYCCMDTATGTLAGNYYPSPGSLPSGFLYQNGHFTSLPWSDANGSSSYYHIAALNNTGIAVGTHLGYSAPSGFVYAKGKIALLNDPGAVQTYFLGINDYGIVVGSYESEEGTSGIFLYNIETGTWTDLNFPLPYNRKLPVGISNTGVIALLGSSAGGLVIATPTGN